MIKATIAGHINRFTSTFHLERPPRVPSSESSVGRRSRSSQGTGSGSGDGVGNAFRNRASTNRGSSSPQSVRSFEHLGYPGQGTRRGLAAALQQRTDSGGRNESASSVSSYDIVPGGETLGAAGHSQARPRVQSNNGSSPPRTNLSNSVTFSDVNTESEASRSRIPSSSDEMVRQGTALPPSSMGGRARIDSEMQAGIVPALLVSVYLDKLQPGIWQNLVVGPAPPVQDEEESQRSQLGAALHEALHSEHSGEGAEEEEMRRHRDRAETSAASIATIASDDSETILGSRPILDRLDQGRPEDAERRKYNMDAQSMAIVGQQVTLRNGGTSQRSGAASSPVSSGNPEEEAFEYFKRAWQKADIPLAISQLVGHYLPLPISAITTPSDESRAISLGNSPVEGRTPVVDATRTMTSREEPHIGSAFRQSYVAALGGNSELARLYVSYARLHLSSSWSPLAFPWGGRNNPFVTRSQRQDYGFMATGATSPTASRPSSVASSSHERASSPGGHDLSHMTASYATGSNSNGWGGAASPSRRISSALHQHVGPLPFLKEAVRLDPDVQIDPEDWEEAASLAEQALAQATEDAEARKAFLEAAVAGEAASPRLNASSRGGPGCRNGGRSRGSRRRDTNGQGEGVVINFVSSAALLSVCLAGSVAALSIWRRVSAAQGN